jgi:prevent-host-death family protein
MSVVNVHEAKTHLSRLLERVEAGETVVIARAGVPIARLTQLEPERARPRTGFLEGAFAIPDDFDRMDEHAIAALFDGSVGNDADG